MTFNEWKRRPKTLNSNTCYFRSTSAFGYFPFDFPFYHRFQRSVRLIVPPLNQHVCFTVCLMHYWKKQPWFMFIIRLSLCIGNTFCWNTSILGLFLEKDNLSKCSGGIILPIKYMYLLVNSYFVGLTVFVS